MNRSTKKFAVTAAFFGTLVLVGSASAQIQMSAGVSGAFKSNFGGGISAEMTMPPIMGGGTTKLDQKQDWAGGGFAAWFDITYVEIGLGMTFGYSSSEVSDELMGVAVKLEESLLMTSLDISVLGKYPIDLGGFVLFPAVGIDYQLMAFGMGEQTITGPGVSESNSGKIENIGDFSRLWFKFGAGADISLTDAIFLRPLLTYGIGLANKFEKDNVDEAKAAGAALATLGGSVKAETILSHGLDIRVGVGFKF